MFKFDEIRWNSWNCFLNVFFSFLSTKCLIFKLSDYLKPWTQKLTIGQSCISVVGVRFSFFFRQMKSVSKILIIPSFCLWTPRKMRNILYSSTNMCQYFVALISTKYNSLFRDHLTNKSVFLWSSSISIIRQKLLLICCDIQTRFGCLDHE